MVLLLRLRLGLDLHLSAALSVLYKLLLFYNPLPFLSLLLSRRTRRLLYVRLSAHLPS